VRNRKSLVKKAPALAGGIIAASLLVSCASIPAGKTAADWLGILPADSSYFLCLNVARTRDLAKSVLKATPVYTSDIEQLVNFSEWLYCGVKIEAGRKPRFALITLGNYPLAIRSVFNGSPDLEPVKADPPYWLYKKFGLEIALPKGYLVAAAKENVGALVRAAETGTALSGVSLEAAREIAVNDLTLYFPLGWDDLVAAETGLVMPRRVFREIWISASLKDGRYYFAGVFHVAADSNAESFKKLLQFFFLALFRRNAVNGAGQRLADMRFTSGDGLIAVSGFYLTRQELEPLIAGILAKGL
jgi:hypothetical protein